MPKYFNKKWEVIDLASIYLLSMPEKEELHLFKVLLTEDRLKNNNLGNLLSSLNQDEINILNSIKSESIKKRFLVSRSILKLLISNYLNIHSSEVIIQSTEYGKPYLSQEYKWIEFNISHSNICLLYTFKLESSVGVDVEYISRKVDILRIAKNILSSKEYQFVYKAHPKYRAYRFYKIWTYKESISKFNGLGLSDPIFVNKLPKGNFEQEINPLLNKNLFVHQFSPLNNYIACIATDKKNKIRYYQLNLDEFPLFNGSK